MSIGYFADIYTKDIDESLRILETYKDTGLSEEEAEARLAQTKLSKPKIKKKHTVSMRIPDQFKDVFVLLLIAAAAVSAVIDNALNDAVLIIVVLISAMIVNSIQKNRVGNTLRKTKKLFQKKARVLRDGVVVQIDISKLVVGDIVYFERGDILPADMRILESNKLLVDEISVTGENEWIRKDAIAVLDSDTPIGERYNIAYMGSVVTFGRGAGAVYALGTETIKGRKAVLSTDTEDISTGLQIELNRVSKSLGIVFIIVCTLTLAAGILYSLFNNEYEHSIYAIIVASLSLVVAAMPKGLGTMATSVMATGVRKMAKEGNIVKNFRSALALGSTAVICTGKTGVLTRNMMTVTQVADSENIYEVTGMGYKAQGHVAAEIMISRNIALMSEIVVLCNNATYDKKNAQIFGEPTEGAMLVFGAKLGHEKEVLSTYRPRLQERPFDSERKIMSTYNIDGDRVIMYTKGAAEEVIARCSYVYLDGEIIVMSDTIRSKLLACCDDFASRALRVMACGYKVYESDADIDTNETDLIYVGTMGLTDPIRDELISSIKRCNDAGLQVKLITGEHRVTAKAIAVALGITKENDEVVDGAMLSIMSDEELMEKVGHVNVFARVSPEHKLRIVTAIHTQTDSMVAMTGVDIDDVPALKKADIGIAMGRSGKDIAHESADIILVDDNLSSLVDAVEEGKTIFSNIRKTVSYVLSCRMCMLLLVFIAIIFGLPLPLSGPLMLLAALIINVLPAQAIGMEAKEIGVLARRIKDPERTVINRRVISSAVSRAILLFTCALAAYLYGFYIVIAPHEISQYIIAVSMCFFALISTQAIISYVVKTDLSMLSSGTAVSNVYVNFAFVLSMLVLIAVIYLPGVSSFLSLTDLSAGQVAICALFIIISTVICEVMKNSTKTAKDIEDELI